MADLPKYVSKSQVKQYLKCGKQYYLERIARYPAPPTWYFIGGTAVHKATERLDQEAMDSWSSDRMEHLWAQAYGEEIDAAYRIWPNDNEWLRFGRRSRRTPDAQGFRYWNERGRTAIIGYANWRVANREKFHLVSIEEEFKVELGGIPVVGYIDRVFREEDHGNVVVDIKNGTKRPDSPLELAIYKHGIERKWAEGDGHFLAPAQEIKRGYWYMAKDEDVFPEDLSNLSLDVVTQLMKTYLEGVEHDVFLPNLGADCYGCPVKLACAAKSGRTEQALRYDPLLKELQSA